MRETKTANRPAPWPQRLSAETLAPAVRRLLGTPRRGREGEQGAGQQRPARAEEVQQDSRMGPRRRGGRRASAARRRFSCWEEEVRPATCRLSVTSRGADVFWADTKREEVGVAERRKMCLFPYRTGPRTTSGRGSW